MLKPIATKKHVGCFDIVLRLLRSLYVQQYYVIMFTHNAVVKVVKLIVEDHC